MEQHFDSFSIYRSIYESLRELPDDVSLRLFYAIGDYALDGTLPELDGLALTFWRVILPNLEKTRQKRGAGSTGGTAERLTQSTLKAELKQTGSKREANRKQTRSKPEAIRIRI